MAIISSNIGDNEFSLRKKELRLVDSKIIPEEKRNKNLNLARPLTLNEFIGQEQLKSSLRICLLYTSPSPRDDVISRMPSSA